MARNGSGTYNLLTNSWNPATNGVSATAVDWQNLANDIAAALTQSLSSDGQTPATGNLPMTGNKLTGLGAGSATGDSVRWEQLFSQGTPQNLVSATTTDIGAQNSVFLNITGTTTITSFGTNYNGPRYVRFDGALTLTHNATTLILPGAANITTAAGDSAIVVPSGSPANGWRVAGYQRSDGSPLAIPNGSVTPAKLSTGGLFWDTSGNVGIGTISPSVYGLHVAKPSGPTGLVVSSGANNGEFVQIGTSLFVANTTAAGVTAFFNNGATRFQIAPDGSQLSVIPGGTALLPQFACRAWVNFNGTGTVAIRASGNVSSITDNGTGDYTVNFITAMPDANYMVAGTAQRNATNDGGNSLALKQGVTALTTSSVRVGTLYAGSSNEDCPQVHVAIFR
jgi:hypothetical protein